MYDFNFIDKLLNFKIVNSITCYSSHQSYLENYLSSLYKNISKRWNNAFINYLNSTEANFGDILIRDNYITTSTSNANLELIVVSIKTCCKVSLTFGVHPPELIILKLGF